MDPKLQNSKIPNFKSKIALPVSLNNKANNTTKPLPSPQKTSIPSASIKTSNLKENEVHRVKSKLYKFIEIYIFKIEIYLFIYFFM